MYTRERERVNRLRDNVVRMGRSWESGTKLENWIVFFWLADANLKLLGWEKKKEKVREKVIPERMSLSFWSVWVAVFLAFFLSFAGAVSRSLDARLSRHKQATTTLILSSLHLLLLFYSITLLFTNLWPRPFVFPLLFTSVLTLSNNIIPNFTIYYQFFLQMITLSITTWRVCPPLYHLWSCILPPLLLWSKLEVVVVVAVVEVCCFYLPVKVPPPLLLPLLQPQPTPPPLPITGKCPLFRLIHPQSPRPRPPSTSPPMISTLITRAPVITPTATTRATTNIIIKKEVVVVSDHQRPSSSPPSFPRLLFWRESFRNGWSPRCFK